MSVALSTDRILERPIFAPTPGPQTAFLECEADWCFYGGMKGGGKSFAVLLDAARWRRVPGFSGIIFRRTTREFTRAGGLIDAANKVLLPMGAIARGGNYLDYRWPGGGRITLSHMQHESDADSHEGSEYAVIAFDELVQFTARQIWKLDSRLRSTCGVRPYLRGTCNPDRDSWVFEFVEWYLLPDGTPDFEKAGRLRWFVRDPETDALRWFGSRAEALAALPGIVPRSFTFIPSSVYDNVPLLEANPEYLGSLQSATKVDRARWLEGNWFVRDGAGLIFARQSFKLADEPPSKVLATVRAWDKAASGPTPKHPDPDWTRGVRVSLCEGPCLWIDDLVGCQGQPGEVLDLMRRTAESDGIHVTVVLWQDTGQAGIVDVDTTTAVLAGFAVEAIKTQSADTTAVDLSRHRSSRAKRAFAKAWAPWVAKGAVYVRRRAPWTGALLSECDGFPDARHDDIPDAISAAFQQLVGGDDMRLWNQLAAGAPKSAEPPVAPAPKRDDDDEGRYTMLAMLTQALGEKR